MADNTENDSPAAPPTDETNNQSEEDQSEEVQPEEIQSEEDQSEEGPSEEVNDGSTESESNSDLESHSVPSYLLGYGSSFVYNQPHVVYNQPQQMVPAQNQAASYSEINDQSESSYSNDQSDSGSGDSEGSGSYYQPNPTNQPNTPPAVSSLSCWRCENALTWGECASSGHLEHCEESADSCQLTVRKRDGKYESITTGCKQKEACENNKRKVQNKNCSRAPSR